MLRLVFAVCLIASLHAADDLAPFPQAPGGAVRQVIRLPVLPDEDAHRVELIIGKTLMLDSVNRFFLAGQLHAENVEGWGYTYYRVESTGDVAGTLMAPAEAQPSVARLVTMNCGDLLRYNSKLPIVVHAPEGFSVAYRVWSAGVEAPATVE